MSRTSGSEAISQIVVDADALFKWVPRILYFLIVSLRHSNTHLTFLHKTLLSAFGTLYIWSMVVPPLFFFQSHRVTLPTWLTFGYSVALGDKTPDICIHAVRVMSPSGKGECFYENLWVWHAKIAGPQGWRYLIHPDATIFVFTGFLAWTILGALFLARAQRNAQSLAARPKLSDVALERPDDKFEGKAKDLEVGFISSELGKDRKRSTRI